MATQCLHTCHGLRINLNHSAGGHACIPDAELNTHSLFAHSDGMIMIMAIRIIKNITNIY